MDIRTLGFDSWFEAQAALLLQPGQSVARVMAVDRGSFLVHNGRSESTAELSGSFRYSVDSTTEMPAVGDWVCVDGAADSLMIIHAVLPRKTWIRRKCPGKTVDFQMIAANIDIAFIVQSCHFDFNIRRLERYLVVASEGHITPIIVLSKTDLVSEDALIDMIGKIRERGISTTLLTISNSTGEGLEEFRCLLDSGRTFCLLGSSGVGKTTIINRLLGNDTFETKTVSATGEGVHTTTRRQLLLLDNGAMLMDTPGMRELGLLGTSDGVEENFSEIGDLSTACRFSDCTHTNEPGCAVLSAVAKGEINKLRYESYLKLRKETEFHDMSYLEKKKKDKDLGRLIKSVKKLKRSE